MNFRYLTISLFYVTSDIYIYSFYFIMVNLRTVLERYSQTVTVINIGPMI
jgi:hypothetical protein